MIPIDPNTLAVEMIPIDELVPDPANPRWIAPAELDALERSMRTFGPVQHVIATRDDRILVAGHQRVTVMRRAGMKFVPTILLDITPERGRLLGIALNKIGGDFDPSLLARAIADLNARPEIDLTLTGFAQKDIDGLLRSLVTRRRREQHETFDVPEAIGLASATLGVQRGDVWALGPHRVACGDATDPQDVAAVLDGGRAAMGFLDPPYNVGYRGVRRRDARRRIPNDDLGPSARETFLRKWAVTLLANVYGAIYVCSASVELPLLSRILSEAGGHWASTVIYAKSRFVVGNGDYQSGYEPIWYGWRDDIKAHYWAGARDRSDVWNIESQTYSPLHSTMKPLELVERAIENSSRPDDVVLDLFLGSGTTVIASERTGRICAGLEIDPVMVEVAVRRWESFTGETAVRICDPGAGGLDEGTVA